MEGCSRLRWPLFHSRDMPGKVDFFFSSTCIVTVNPHDVESASISGKLRRKGQRSSFRFTLLFTHILLSPTYLWRSQWFIKIGRCHHADDTVSTLNIISAFAYLHSVFLFFPVLSSCSFTLRLISRFDIPKGNYHPPGSLSICGDR